ncbi:hypothetical protein MAR_005501, partial [Mya arenaria]
EWARVLFSDESRFNLSHHDGKVHTVVCWSGIQFGVVVSWLRVESWTAETLSLILLLFRAVSMLKATLTRFCSQKQFHSCSNMDLLL